MCSEYRVSGYEFRIPGFRLPGSMFKGLRFVITNPKHATTNTKQNIALGTTSQENETTNSI
jgi:hypothetical protein